MAKRKAEELTTEETIDDEVTLVYNRNRFLKYGCNAQQQPAAILTRKGLDMPFEVVNGNPGYINLLDAMNAWQLVKELDQATGLVAATSFKHVSPAGAAVGVELSDTMKEIYHVGNKELTPTAIAYIRARQADPKSSFGDFVAISRTVDKATANILKFEVSDGIIAPDYEPEALEILKKKKKGGFIILKANPDYEAPTYEYREVFGLCFAQKRNQVLLTKEHMSKPVTQKKDMSDNIIRDLLVASITLKYTQSNSVGYAVDGQMVGVGAGQQSRVDCVKLAGSKVETWYLRQHPKVRALKFKEKIKKNDKVNAIVAYIEGDFTDIAREEFEKRFEEGDVPEPLTLEDKKEWLAGLTGISLASDAFFPFADNIDHCSRRGVSYISQPGGSVQDPQVIEACDKYGIGMVFTETRLFHH